METRDKKTSEEQYRKYFSPREDIDVDDDSLSLEQPSFLDIVESFTTYGVTEDLSLQRG